MQEQFEAQQTHSTPSTSTEPLVFTNVTLTRPAVLRPIGRRTQFIPAPTTADSFTEQTEIALRPVHAQGTSELRLPAVQYRLQENASLSLAVGGCSDPGIKRKASPNEDSIFAIQGIHSRDIGSLPFGLFVVADGMGGHTNGQEASRMAIKVFSDDIVPAVLHDVVGDEGFPELLLSGVYRANLALYQRSRQQQALMGTTLTAALVVGTTAYVTNVGDSRTYLYRKSKGLSQITRDHSIVARMVEEKVIQPDDIYTHPRRNEIYRCLGEHASIRADSFTMPLQAGDSLLLCSDGLWEMVRDADIQRILEYCGSYASQASTLLLQAALNGGGKDNVSIIVIHVA